MVLKWALPIFFLMVSLLSGCGTTSQPYIAVIRITEGDTLSDIAEYYGVSVASIRFHNGLVTDFLEVGQILEVPVNPQVAEPRRREGLLFGGGRLLWPVKGPVSSRFGPRGGRMHEGIDIKAAPGTVIVAAHAGRVVHSGWSRGYGRTVIIESKNHRTLYAHCRKLNARKGQWVERGQPIAYVGKSGNARGYHLHFEVRDRQNRPHNPLEILDQSVLYSRR